MGGPQPGGRQVECWFSAAPAIWRIVDRNNMTMRKIAVALLVAVIAVVTAKQAVGAGYERRSRRRRRPGEQQSTAGVGRVADTVHVRSAAVAGRPLLGRQRHRWVLPLQLHHAGGQQSGGPHVHVVRSRSVPRVRLPSRSWAAPARRTGRGTPTRRPARTSTSRSSSSIGTSSRPTARRRPPRCRAGAIQRGHRVLEAERHAGPGQVLERRGHVSSPAPPIPEARCGPRPTPAGTTTTTTTVAGRDDNHNRGGRRHDDDNVVPAPPRRQQLAGGATTTTTTAGGSTTSTTAGSTGARFRTGSTSGATAATTARSASSLARSGRSYGNQVLLAGFCSTSARWRS